VAGGLYIYWHINDEIRRHVEFTFADHYADYDVHVQSARILENEGIEIRGLTIAQPGRDEPLLAIDEIFLACDTDLDELATGQPQIEKIVVRRPTLRAARDTSGRWDVARLLPLPQLGGEMPPTSIEDATLVVRFSEAVGAALVLSDGRLTIERQAPPPGTPRDAEMFVLRGTIGGQLAQHIEFTGTSSPSTGGFHFEGDIQRLALDAELLAALPVALPQHLESLNTFRGSADIRVEAHYDPAQHQQPQFAIAATVDQGQMQDPRLPHPLSDVQATLRCTNELIAIDRLTAHCGPTTLSLAGQQRGLKSGSPLTLTASAERIPLSANVFAGLPGKLPELWQKFQPRGMVSLENAKLTFDGQRWQPEGTIRCHDVAFAYDKFPYPVEKSTGTITQRGNHLSVDLVAHAGDQPVTIRSELDNPGPSQTGWVEVRGQHLKIDEKLIPAIAQRFANASRVIEQLHATGLADVFFRAWRDSPAQPKMRTQVELDIVNGSVQYDRFPYPIYGIQGRIEATDGQWILRQLQGTNDTARIVCNGTIRPPTAGGGIHLTFTGDNVPLEEELRLALDPKTQQLWSDLRPRGHIDVLEATITTQPGQAKPSVVVRLQPHGESASIEPSFFPLRFDKLAGTVAYQDGHADFQNVRAVHGATRVATNGGCDCRPDGSWSVAFQDVAVERLNANDPQLRQALPPGLRSVVEQLDPNGIFNLQGSFSLAGRSEPPTPSASVTSQWPVTSEWNVTLITHQTDIDCGIELSDVRGAVQLAGDFDGQRVQCRGDLSIDSLVFLDSQFTQVRGPFAIDNQYVYLGSQATRYLGEQPQTINAQLFGGTFTTDGRVILADVPRYSVRTTLQSAQLQRFANETLPGTQKLAGNVMADAEFNGSGRTVDSLRGKGWIRIRDAYIYELPLVMKLFSALRLTATETPAFTGSEMEFRIQGQNLLFDKLNLMGTAITLYGKGDVDFDRQANLTFHSLMGPNRLNLPIFKSLLGQASEQMMQIHVTGDLADPEITTELLPGVNETLRSLQPDAPAARNWLSLVPDPLGVLQPSEETPTDRR